jgi:hypothetical protein
LFERDRRRRHGDDATDDDGGLPIDAEECGGCRNKQGCEGDLQATGTEHGRPHGDHRRQRELDPDHEHQKDDAELGEKLGAFAGRQNREAVRPDRQTGEEIADDGRKSEPFEQADGAGGCDNDDKAFSEKRTLHGSRLRLACSSRPGPARSTGGGAFTRLTGSRRPPSRAAFAR